MKCKYCEGTGIVGLTTSGTSWAFRCNCQFGGEQKNGRFPLWNGLEKHYFQNKEYIYPLWEAVLKADELDRQKKVAGKVDRNADSVPF